MSGLPEPVIGCSEGICGSGSARFQSYWNRRPAPIVLMMPRLCSWIAREGSRWLGLHCGRTGAFHSDEIMDTTMNPSNAAFMRGTRLC